MGVTLFKNLCAFTPNFLLELNMITNFILLKKLSLFWKDFLFFVNKK